MALTPTPSVPLARLGFDPASEQLYRVVLRHPGSSIDSLCDRLGRSRTKLEHDLAPLVERRLVSVTGDEVTPEPPEFSLGRLLNQEAQRLAEAERALALAQRDIQAYVGEYLAGQQPSGWRPVSIDVVPDSELADVMVTLTNNSGGELRFLRPDQWFLPTGQRMDAAVTAAITSGRRSRAIYPGAVIDTPSESVQSRSLAGERIRVMPTVPTRMAVFGTEAAVIPEMWGSTAGARLLVRQPAVVAACAALFDQLWSRAVTVPGFDDDVASGTTRHQLLELLARGAKDEQIARSLGVSLRTVRRWIATLMAELDVESRFQAGVEAVRHGWV